MSWKSKPSWYIVANKDRAVQAEPQRSVAKHVGATVFETDSSHVLKLGQRDLVLDVIRKAANAVQHLRQRNVHRTYFSEPEVNLADAKSEAPLQTSAGRRSHSDDHECTGRVRMAERSTAGSERSPANAQ
jgi:hypothetical protein